MNTKRGERLRSRSTIFRTTSVESLEQRMFLAADLGSLRTQMPGEGYLEYYGNMTQSPFYGHERSGWTDVRDPSGFTDGNGQPFKDTNLGYDWSVLRAHSRTVTAAIEQPVGPIVKGIDNSATIRKQFDVANQVFAQVGITVFNEYEGL